MVNTTVVICKNLQVVWLFMGISWERQLGGVIFWWLQRFNESIGKEPTFFTKSNPV